VAHRLQEPAVADLLVDGRPSWFRTAGARERVVPFRSCPQGRLALAKDLRG
jgi:hypothetical protein